jgi:hypothetical protein
VKRSRRLTTLLVCLALAIAAPAWGGGTQLEPVVPKRERGASDYERSGTHDAGNIRTVFWNYGMVGDYPPDPIKVDLSVFHSAEVPKGSGMNYSDGITPFVLAKIPQVGGDSTYIMETGFRERQAVSPFSPRVMRFEPRPGYFQSDPSINRGRSPAISNDRRTWPPTWPDKRNDVDDPGWPGSWNGYFGKRAAEDHQESFTVMDDDYYDAWRYYPDSRDSTRHGLGLRVEVRGFQWSNPQAGNVIFWHYEITNEGTTDYDNNIIFGLYMDSGVGGSGESCDGIPESDDDNAFFDKSFGLNLVYTWDRSGRGKDLAGPCSPTGYLGYAYLETPGNALNGIDDDSDGITDEVREDTDATFAGHRIVGREAILDSLAARCDTTKFVAFYGPLVKRPAYRAGVWWTGDEDLDWRADIDDLGADGVAHTGDTGEGDGRPTGGEPNFGRTDLNESDQIGLTGFKMNRIRIGAGNQDPGAATDGILFYTDDQNWPARLYRKFTNPVPPETQFDAALASNYNIAFLFASGPFSLKAGKTERFSLALAYGADLTELRETVHTVQLIYAANYQFAVPPPPPIVEAEAGDGRVRLSWSDGAERGFDPVTSEYDFEGYRIYRSTDPEFRDPRVITTGKGTGLIGNGKPIAQFDLKDGKRGFTRKTIEGVSYWLGEETGITHTWTDSTVTNGQEYYYAVCAYDYGFDAGPLLDSLTVYPSENPITVSRTPRGGVILPSNVVVARPNRRAPGYVDATTNAATHALGTGTGSASIEVVNSDLVPDGHLFTIGFVTPHEDSIRASAYVLRDSTSRRELFSTGADFAALGVGPVGSGLLPRVSTIPAVTLDTLTRYAPGSPTNSRLKITYLDVLSPNERRPGYPDDISIVFDDVVRDTSLVSGARYPARPAKFRVIAHTATGDLPLNFRFRDCSKPESCGVAATDLDSMLSAPAESFDIFTYSTSAPTTPSATWRVELDTLGQGVRGPIRLPRLGDTFDIKPLHPLSVNDMFVFSTSGAKVTPRPYGAGFEETPYVVPNPYIGAAGFEPERYAVSGRGERRIEFRAIPQNSTIRIYTVHGDLVQTLRQDGSTNGYVPWNLRTKDNLDMAPGLYIFQVDAPDAGSHIGKFAVIK